MKVFIYHNLISNDLFRSHNAVLAQANNLHPHLQYLEDFYQYFKQFETTSPEDADYFFVPLFMAGWQFANLNPVEFIESVCVHRGRGNHILIASGDFGQRGVSKYELQDYPKRAYREKYTWLDDRFILIALESTSGLHPQDIAFLPYQTAEIPLPHVERDIFLSFMGAMHYDLLDETHIRGRSQKLQQFRDRNRNAGIVIGTPDEVAIQLGESVSYHDLMARSVCTLVPAGYGRWSFRLVEALLNGSIPVILSDGYILPFGDRISWQDCTIVVPEQNFLQSVEVAGSLPVREVFRKQQFIRANRALFGREFSLQSVGQILGARADNRRSSASPADRAISRMRGPSEMQIICVDVTNKCDLACSNCTRLLANQDKLWEMTPDNFRLALRSLKGYTGLIAMIGGNPCMHSKFPELCSIFVEEIPERRQRGLWTNNTFKHQEMAEQTFGAFNLNPHNVPRAVSKLQALYDKIIVQQKCSGDIYKGHSHHSPLLTAIRDLYPEEEMWEKIVKCDINRFWSASITQNDGELTVYFCEVAASFDLARNQNHGFPVTEGWWRQPIQAFSCQIKKFCPGCGVPARLTGHLDCEETDTYTDSNADLAAKSVARTGRKAIHLRSQGSALGHAVTRYAEGERQGPVVSKVEA